MPPRMACLGAARASTASPARIRFAAIGRRGRVRGASRRYWTLKPRCETSGDRYQSIQSSRSRSDSHKSLKPKISTVTLPAKDFRNPASTSWSRAGRQDKAR